MTYAELERLYRGRIGENSILCTDGHKNYIHSKLKKWMEKFNGVATKYISNYLYLFKWLELFENDKETIKVKNFIVQCNVAHTYTKITDFREREPIFV